MPLPSLSYSPNTFKILHFTDKIKLIVHNWQDNGVSRFYQNSTLLPAQASPERTE